MGWLTVKPADLLDRLSLYLPVLLMGVMAMATYWLVRATPGPSAVVHKLAPQHEPDYSMRGFSVKTFYPSGALKSEVKGAVAHHYPDTDTLDIEHVAIRSFDAMGRLTTARANRAQINADGSQVALLGQAEVVRAAVAGAQARAELRVSGEQLQADLNARRVTSQQPVLIQRGGDRIRANSLDYDERAGLVSMQGQVQGLLMPPAAKSKR
jgi:lipopolysaccharide export system protein LptC